ncbi:MAG TPA: phage/plasmid primase, P4 family [Tepidisphaeraceae bacterium]|nr:phage/plasmid primase, P4 family [Tepidisphaeraceae bacterium]
MSAMPLRLTPAEDPAPLPNAAPRTLAGAFIASHRRHERHFRGDFYQRDRAVYRREEREVLRAEVADFLADVFTLDREGNAKRYIPNAARINDVLDAMSTLAQVRVDSLPAWLDHPHSRPQVGNVIAFQNGLIDLAEYLAGEVRLMPPNPLWFSTNVLPFDFTQDAPAPAAWWNFLGQLWADDEEAAGLLQEWFGYCLTANTAQQKIAMLCGPPRSGKGTIARILTKLIGPENIAAPTLAGLGGNFGLSPLLGKSLAIISDARLSGRSDLAVVTERLLSLSGEDSLTVDRKCRESVTLRLPTRIMLLSNELPKLSDASGALAERFLILVLKRSFLGAEDVNLTEKLSAELPGILLWSLEGLRRLHQRGRFFTPASADAAMEELRELVSPIKAFFNERCEVGAGRCVEASALYEAWCAWAKSQGREHAGTVQTFGRDVRAAIPSVEMSQPRLKSGERTRVYEGVSLRL